MERSATLVYFYRRQSLSYYLIIYIILISMSTILGRNNLISLIEITGENV
jgi:hypothetical protein